MPLQASLIVVDVDGDHSNGPDTLTAETGDTLTLDVWILAVDSMHAFGITLGDSSGATRWVPEAASAVYSTPGSWSDVAVQTDSDSSIIVLQSTDFGLDTHIASPSKLATVRFTVSSLDSCLRIVVNLAESGWFEVSLGDSAFDAFEGPVFCSGEESAGAGGGESEGSEGNEEESPEEKPSFLGRYDCYEELIEVMFAPESRVRMRNGALVDLSARNALNDLETVTEKAGEVTWRRFSSVPESRFDELKEVGESRSGKSLYNMNNIYIMRIPASADEWQLCLDLEKLPGVLRARPLPDMPLDQACSVPLYDSLQVYLDSAGSTPTGIDAEYAWTQPGGDGSNVTVCVVEKRFYWEHEDLTRVDSASEVNPDAWKGPSWPVWISDQHATQVAGIVVGDSNSFGVTGIAHGATFRSAITSTDVGGPVPFNYIPSALAAAAASLTAGDVISVSIAVEYGGMPSVLLPVEWHGDAYPDSQSLNSARVAIETAVANRINVVLAAGNTSANIDSLPWLEDSGAIIVGAGGSSDGGDTEFCPQGDLQRCNGGAQSGSNYGDSVDVQGIGKLVVTTGKGDFDSSGGKSCYFSGDFNGTSSATPMVAGAVANIVSYWKENISPVPPQPRQIRELLIRTGTAQINPETGHIGPRPDLKSALGEITATSVSLGEAETVKRVTGLRIAPNPGNPKTRITFMLNIAMDVIVTIHDVQGRTVTTLLDRRLGAGEHSVEWDGRDTTGRSAASGIYFCQLRFGGRVESERMVLLR